MRWWVTFLVGVMSLASGLAYSNFVFLTVSGSSMEPTITSDDLVVVEPGAGFGVGDVVTYQHRVEGETYTFTHRVVGVEGDSLRTKGDSLAVEDRYEVEREDVVGRVVLVIPMVGGFLRFVDSPVGLPAFVLFPASLLILAETRSVWRELRCG